MTAATADNHTPPPRTLLEAEATIAALVEENENLKDAFFLCLAGVTRITVVDPGRGRAFESWNYSGVEMHLQDGGRTLKLFPGRKPALPIPSE